ncbi:MAG: hypothetical protein RL095_3007 [Verrucomicrobiota bacterium]|jgi:hypothetical protein
MNPFPSKRRPYTLLGLVFLLFLLALAASSAAFLPSLQADAEVDRLNRERLAALKEAICGNLDSDTAILSPAVSGYVADMGRLPLNLNELLVQGAQVSWTVDSVSNVSGKFFSPGVAYGWRGPYLNPRPGRVEFRDGWQNVDGSSVEDALNFGWLLPSSASISTLNSNGRGTLTLTSRGKDGLAGGSGYDADLSASIIDSDYNVDISQLYVQFKFDELAKKEDFNGQIKNKNVRLAFVTSVNADLSWSTLASSACMDMVSSFDSNSSVANTFNVNFNANNSRGLPKRAPWGRRYLAVLTDEAAGGAGTLKDHIIAVAQCDSPLFLHPRQTLPYSSANPLVMTVYLP